MRLTSTLKNVALIILGVAAIFAGCKPDSDKNTLTTGDDAGSGYPSDLSRIELVNEDVISLADNAGLLYNGAHMRTSGSGCATVGIDTFSTPRVLTIRFGDKDCVCLDGRTRRGTIIVKYNGRYGDTAKVHEITFDNYYINDNRLTGTIKTIKVDTTVTGNWYYKVTANDSLNMSPDPLKSQFLVWSGSFVRKWVEGKLTDTRADDIFSVSGNGTLTRPSGHAFSCDISTPIEIALGCDFARSGVVNVTNYEGTRVLNFGAGSCDAQAQLNINVHVYSLLLNK